MKLHLFNNLANFYAVPAGATDENAKEVVARNVPCSAVYPPISGIYAIGKQQQERANMASLTQQKILYTAVPANIEITTAMRVEVRNKEYGIRDITQWTDDDPHFLELLIEAE